MEERTWRHRPAGTVAAATDTLIRSPPSRPVIDPLRYWSLVDMAEARRTFRDVRAAHVGSVLADGSPHVVPLWFVWLDDAIYVTCRRGSTVRRNIARDPRVAITMDRGQAWTEQAGCVVRGEAETLRQEDPAVKRALSAWFEKYRTELSGFGFAAYAQQVVDPVILRVRPDGLATWVHAYQPRG